MAVFYYPQEQMRYRESTSQQRKGKKKFGLNKRIKTDTTPSVQKHKMQTWH